ncbi:MAG: hypothetical protein JNL74_07405, partial [Fibrobacteres bacterium]|nr:hypothetical protein [Fibrobacterota bacterium]
MGAISGTTNQQADAVIEQYKSYYSKMNISQYGTGVLLQTLGESGDAEEAFGANYSSQSNGLEELFASQASKVSINKDNIKKKMWADLEKEVQAFFQENKELRGQYVVAVNNATENGQPEFKI